jgi:osmotically inducible lipoprotein OsmB
MAVGDPDLLELQAVLTHRIQNQIQVTTRVYHRSLTALVIPNQRTILLKGRDRNGLVLKHGRIIEKAEAAPSSTPATVCVHCPTDLCSHIFYLDPSEHARAFAGATLDQRFIHSHQEPFMKTLHPLIRTTSTVLLVLASLSITACAGMTQQERHTAIGAGVGAVGGAILTGGSTTGTLGGAAVGGVIGHEIKK